MNEWLVPGLPSQKPILLASRQTRLQNLLLSNNTLGFPLKLVKSFSLVSLAIKADKSCPRADVVY